MLSIFANSSVTNRLTNEFKFIKNNNYLQILSINITENLINIKILDKNYSKNNIYTFLINKNYPFTQPNVFINNITYIQFMQIKSPETLKLLKEIWGYDCLCCSTYMCSDNWRPTIKILNIIEEIQFYRNIRLAIMYKILCNKISQKYLLKDIKLEEWLY
jgi:ubiquitin-protein ligase